MIKRKLIWHRSVHNGSYSADTKYGTWMIWPYGREWTIYVSRLGTLHLEMGSAPSVKAAKRAIERAVRALQGKRK